MNQYWLSFYSILLVLAWFAWDYWASRRDKNTEVLNILKDTLEKYDILEDEANIKLLHKGDTEFYRQSLEEMAQLLINLPNLLLDKFEGVDSEIKQRVMKSVALFATRAKEAMTMETTFCLGAMLIDHGDKKSAKNDLEKLIDFVENN